MARPTKFTIALDGVPELRRVYRTLDVDARRLARERTKKISETEATRIKNAASTPQQRLIAGTVRARQAREPTIVMGGAARLPSRSRRRRQPTAGDLVFGAEFGAQRYPQFPRHRGRTGYFFWPTLRADTDRMFTEWATVIRELADTFDRG